MVRAYTFDATVVVAFALFVAVIVLWGDLLCGRAS
jgi:hypothetical protein